MNKETLAIFISAAILYKNTIQKDLHRQKNYFKILIYEWFRY